MLLRCCALPLNFYLSSFAEANNGERGRALGRFCPNHSPRPRRFQIQGTPLLHIPHTHTHTVSTSLYRRFILTIFPFQSNSLQMMHGKSGENTIIDTEENLPAAEADNETSELETTTNIEETAEILQSKEESPLELQSSAKYVGFSNSQERNVPPTNDIPVTESVSPGKHTVSADLKCQNEATCYSDGPEKYSKLLNKYYEVESQRQHILQQLNGYSNWNYQYPFSSTSTAEENQTYVPQPYETVACHCPYGCQNWVVPCNSSPAACSGGNHIDTTSHAKDSQNGNSGSQKDPDFVNTAMMAAKKALALTKEANRGTDKQLGMEIGQFPESKSATDLDVVLNAWYTAGFYTGKYLSEQSSDGRKQGEGDV